MSKLAPTFRTAPNAATFKIGILSWMPPLIFGALAIASGTVAGLLIGAAIAYLPLGFKLTFALHDGEIVLEPSRVRLRCAYRATVPYEAIEYVGHVAPYEYKGLFWRFNPIWILQRDASRQAMKDSYDSLTWIRLRRRRLLAGFAVVPICVWSRNIRVRLASIEEDDRFIESLTARLSA